MLIDSHCHLASHQFKEPEISELIQRAKDHDVTRMVTLATNLEDAKTNLDIAALHPEVFACIGIHPCDVHETPDDYLAELEGHARHPRCVAIGETGLDYYHPAPDGWSDDDYHARQRAFLEQHFQLAHKLEKNIVIHTRDRSGQNSLDDALEIYRKHADKVRAVFHCFPFDFASAAPILELGGLISFTGIATFKNARLVLDTARQCPRGSFMLETDSPYLAPVPHRGKRNEPAYTRHTAESIASARNEPLEDLAEHTTATAETFYRFPESSTTS
ncbi:TatD family hydrolase [Verrucomicrobiaceae bacterium N1E253]|uniref:TatD family hydrolase n=1 Tax=Oceaniferula marina TaxID=2748318 RepID=A0A851GFV3_9BACT|nr:TatD family hydrolase [Oceaniferula marina]NWK54047.1 TatD family hydrolase [Oceaniferula marina]